MQNRIQLPTEFIEQAMRTNSDKTGSFDIKPDTIHAILGIVSETNELFVAEDAVNAFEEFADIFWFAALFQKSTGVKLDFTLTESDHEIDVVSETADMLDRLKACYAYGNKRGQSATNVMYLIAENISRTVRGIALLLAPAFPGQTYLQLVESAQQTVINKLRARYPDKFTVEHAHNRDLGYEREVLENSVPK